MNFLCKQYETLHKLRLQKVTIVGDHPNMKSKTSPRSFYDPHTPKLLHPKEASLLHTYLVFITAIVPSCTTCSCRYREMAFHSLSGWC